MLLWTFPLSAACCSLLLALGLSSLCRGGFFTMPEGPERRASIEDNRRAIEETATLAAAGARSVHALCETPAPRKGGNNGTAAGQFGRSAPPREKPLSGRGL